MGDAVKDEVKAHYADLALGETPSCCWSNYSPEDLEGLPGEAILSLGCGGNPVALANLTTEGGAKWQGHRLGHR